MVESKAKKTSKTVNKSVVEKKETVVEKKKTVTPVIQTKVKAEKSATEKHLIKQLFTGRRKDAVARVIILPGSGNFEINKLKMEKYFPRETYRQTILKPLSVTKTLGQFDVFCTVKGGGHTGQAGAILLGLARALNSFNPDFHALLKQNGLLTRDSRVVERKKYGKHKARKSTQFSKR